MKIQWLVISILLLAPPTHAFFGMLGRDQCGYQQSAFPTSPSDANNAARIQLQALYSQRQQMQGKFAQLNTNILSMQGSIRGYMHSPWSEAMLAHMDNGYDCCAPTGVYAILQLPSSERRPAGQDLYPPENNEIKPVDPTPEPPPYSPPAYTPPAPPTSACQGHPAQYCSNNWGQPYSPPRQGGGLCLQTGFASNPAWYQAACRNGGKIDPQVCSHPQIAKQPSQYRECINTLSAYQNASVQKRQLGAHIQEINGTIARFNGTGSGGATQGSEIKTGVGGLLGNIVSTIGPFMLSQYMAYQQDKSVSQTQYGPGSFAAKYGPPRPVTNVNGTSAYYPPPYQQPPTNYPQPPPPNYGPRYGYPFSYGGNYGATLPNYQQGGFGCSPGSMNNGMSLISTLLGGGTGLNLNANLQSSFGPNGGSAPYQAYLNGYGNQYAGIPPYTFTGHTPPYQPGGIYGTTPTYNLPSTNGNQAIPNYFSRFNINFNPNVNQSRSFPPYSYAPTNYNNVQPQTNNFGWQYNSYFYAQAQNNQQMLLENEARMRQRSMNLQFQTNQLNVMNSGYKAYYPPGYGNSSYSSGYQNPFTYSKNPSAYNYVDMNSVMQSLMMGNSVKFNIKAGTN